MAINDLDSNDKTTNTGGFVAFYDEAQCCGIVKVDNKNFYKKFLYAYFEVIESAREKIKQGDVIWCYEAWGEISNLILADGNRLKPAKSYLVKDFTMICSEKNLIDFMSDFDLEYIDGNHRKVKTFEMSDTDREKMCLVYLNGDICGGDSLLGNIIAKYVQKIDIVKLAENYFVKYSAGGLCRPGKDETMHVSFYDVWENNKINGIGDKYIRTLLPKMDECIYSESGFESATRMAERYLRSYEKDLITESEKRTKDIRAKAIEDYSVIGHVNYLYAYYRDLIFNLLKRRDEALMEKENIWHYENTLQYFNRDIIAKPFNKQTFIEWGNSIKNGNNAPPPDWDSYSIADLP